MSTRIFAIIIGIDDYKSGSIWNLHGCVEDAKKMKHWLTDSLNVPKDQICLLLDKQATKQKIEESFTQHLVNNPCIERGDAILLYFAGHGSSLRAPADWYQSNSMTDSVQVLCTFDHDTKTSEGRISGISDRSLHAMMDDLACSRGDNITLLLDCCFSPSQTIPSSRDRGVVRWTSTSKAGREDLYRDLWPGARGKIHPSKRGFFHPDIKSHTSLLATSHNGRAGEDKSGGRFTTAFLYAAADLPLHRTSYAEVIDHLREMDGEGQQYSCFGRNKNRVIFNDVPFSTDRRLSPVTFDLKSKILRTEIGDIHGVVQGTELSIHLHNRQWSPNPSIACAIVTDIGPSWCNAHLKTQGIDVPKSCWAKITRWNNKRPFRVHLKSTFSSFIRMWKLHRRLSTTPGNTTSPSGLNVMKVKHPTSAEISLTMGRNDATVVQHNPPLLDQEQHIARIRKSDGLEVIDDAARFNLHLVHKHPAPPLQRFIQMELYQLDATSWAKIGVNNLHDSTATITYQKGAIYQVVLRNNSQTDLWPYLAYLDPSRFSITMLYHPDASTKEAPLRSRGHLEIGSGKPGSEALSFALPEDNHHDYGYLKLFLSSEPVDLRILEQEPDSQWLNELEFGKPLAIRQKMPIWDTILASLEFVRHPDSNS